MKKLLFLGLIALSIQTFTEKVSVIFPDNKIVTTYFDHTLQVQNPSSKDMFDQTLRRLHTILAINKTIQNNKILEDKLTDTQKAMILVIPVHFEQLQKAITDGDSKKVTDINNSLNSLITDLETNLADNPIKADDHAMTSRELNDEHPLHSDPVFYAELKNTLDQIGRDIHELGIRVSRIYVH